jgi:hypothetical protein
MTWSDGDHRDASRRMNLYNVAHATPNRDWMAGLRFQFIRLQKSTPTRTRMMTMSKTMME